jgi:aldose sugar dehydrogenase
LDFAPYQRICTDSVQKTIAPAKRLCRVGSKTKPMLNIKRLILVISFFTSFACRGQELLVRTVADSLDTPWEILWGPDNWIWMTERYGRISRVNPATGQVKQLIKIPDIYEQSESGLLGMALHPDFGTKPLVYVAYTHNQAGFKERIVRYTYYQNGDSLGGRVVLLDGIAASTNHDGCRLVFGPDKKLYISTGDATNTNYPQETYSLNGKILRMNEDGSIPVDNPYGNSYVWATGLRNTQGLAWVNGKLYGSEHGPNNDDELNLLMGGRNFGWPNVHGFCDLDVEKQFCEDSNVVEPLYAWTPTVALAGLDYYPSGGPISKWENSLLVTTLKGSRLIVFRLVNGGDSISQLEEVYSNQYGRLRDVCISPDGRVFIATSNRDGRGSPAPQDDRILALLAPNSIWEWNAYASDFQVLGNPAQNQLLLQNSGPNKEIRVTDLMGRIIYTNRILSHLQIDCSGWTNGVYLVQHWDKNSSGVIKIIVSH